jgi:hypothetical protein
MNVIYTPLSLKKLCINKILKEYDFLSISQIIELLNLEILNVEHDFMQRRQVLQWCHKYE